MKVKYDNHDIGWELATTVQSFIDQANSWRRRDTVYGWLEERRMSFLLPLVKKFPECNWLTVGDGRFGLDASWIRSNGPLNVHATDVSDRLLKIGFEKGYIKSFSEQNAEDLNFDDDSFDFVLIKDSLHHCPRPYHALYELLRVARSCVVIIEPIDIDQDHLFESVGNYIYKLSIRDYEKFLLGMHYRHIAYKGFNDCFIQGVENCPLEGGDQLQADIRNKVFSNISEADERCKSGNADYPFASIILFKVQPSDLLVNALVSHGYIYDTLPKNPHIKRYQY